MSDSPYHVSISDASIEPSAPDDTPWTLARILQLMDEQQRTGILYVSHEGHDVRLHIRHGYVVHVDETAGSDQWVLGQFLLGTNTLSSERLLAAQQRAESLGLSLGETLVSQRLVSDDTLKRFNDLQVKEILFPLFHEQGMALRFAEERPLQPKYVSPLPVAYILKEAQRRAESWSTLRQTVGSRSAVYRKQDVSLSLVLGISDEGLAKQQHHDSVTNLSASARLVFYFVNGQKTVEQLARATGLGIFDTYTVLVELLEADLVAIHELRGEGEITYTGTSAQVRAISIVSYLLLALVVGFSVQWLVSQGSHLTQSITVDSGQVDSLVSKVHINQIHQALEHHELRFGRYPDRLEDLLDTKLLVEEARSVFDQLAYTPTSTHYELVRY